MGLKVAACINNGIVENTASYDEDTSQKWLEAVKNNYDKVVIANPDEVGIGYSYNEQENIFVQPQPYPSWTKNLETYLWEAPTPMPTDGNMYQWNEELLQWKEITND